MFNQLMKLLLPINCFFLKLLSNFSSGLNLFCFPSYVTFFLQSTSTYTRPSLQRKEVHVLGKNESNKRTKFVNIIHQASKANLPFNSRCAKVNQFFSFLQTKIVSIASSLRGTIFLIYVFEN